MCAQSYLCLSGTSTKCVNVDIPTQTTHEYQESILKTSKLFQFSFLNKGTFALKFWTLLQWSQTGNKIRLWNILAQNKIMNVRWERDGREEERNRGGEEIQTRTGDKFSFNYTFVSLSHSFSLPLALESLLCPKI